MSQPSATLKWATVGTGVAAIISSIVTIALFATAPEVPKDQAPDMPPPSHLIAANAFLAITILLLLANGARRCGDGPRMRPWVC